MSLRSFRGGLWLLGVMSLAFLRLSKDPNLVGERGSIGISAQRGWLPVTGGRAPL
jgi:hypothetical protein